jgi:hypothetical protein
MPSSGQHKLAARIDLTRAEILLTVTWRASAAQSVPGGARRSRRAALMRLLSERSPVVGTRPASPRADAAANRVELTELRLRALASWEGALRAAPRARGAARAREDGNEGCARSRPIFVCARQVQRLQTESSGTPEAVELEHLRAGLSWPKAFLLHPRAP